MKFRQICVLCACILVVNGCSQGTRRSSVNKVVLILDISDKHNLFFDRTSTIKYVDDYQIPHVFSPFDTTQYKFVVHTTRERIEIQYHNRSEIARHFYLRNGDSVLIKLEQGVPILKILNRHASDTESNFELNSHQNLYATRASALAEFYYYLEMKNNDATPGSRIISIELDSLRKKVLVETEGERSYIDSLLKDEVIDSDLAAFYKEKIDFNSSILGLFNGDGIDFSDTPTVRSIQASINKSPRMYTFHDDFITMYYQVYLSKQLLHKPRTEITRTLERDSTTFGKAVLFKYLNEIMLLSTVNIGKHFLASFGTDTLSQYWRNYLYTKYNHDQKFNRQWIVSDDLKNSLSFETILLENKGRLLYIDLWASWCLESIRELPSLEKLYADYRTRGVNVVHISVDRDVEKWKWAAKEYLAYNRMNSYMISNPDLKTISEEFSVYTLPRYLLFDQMGNLIHANAPKPSSKEILGLFDAYLESQAVVSK